MPTQDIVQGQSTTPSREPLPLRADAPDLPACDPPQRDIHKTAGGKITDFFIYQILGFGGNSSLSVGVTYWINPKPQVKKFRESVVKGAQNLFKGVVPEHSVGNAVEIGFMLISGTALTAIMAPLVNRRDKIAYWVNQKLGKDTDVLPENMVQHGKPLTMEDRVEQELKKRVRYGQTSRDLWKARWSAIWVPLLGDSYLGKLSAAREAEGKWSVDTVSWKAGQHLYDKVLPKDKIEKLGNFFKKHHAGIEDVKTNNPGIYERLLKAEQFHDEYNVKMLNKQRATAAVRDDRMMIADQARLLGKEVGWTLVLSEIVEKLTCTFQIRRIRKQERKAIAHMREEGIIPSGVHVTTDAHGHVTLTKTKDYVPPVTVPAQPAAPEEGHGLMPADASARKWADEKVKAVTSPAVEDPAETTRKWAENRVKEVAAAASKGASHAVAVQKGRQQGEEQPSLA